MNSSAPPKPEDLQATRMSTYGSHQWGIIHVPTGAKIAGPREIIDHPECGLTEIMGSICWRRKKDAQQVIDDYTVRYNQRERNR